MIDFEKIKVLIEGYHTLIKPNNVDLYSTITLIKSDKNILVDTGSFGFDRKIIASLKKEGLTPDDIDVVLLTHMHIDHTINLHLFSNAKIYAKFINTYPGQYHVPKTHQVFRTEIIDGTKIAKDVEVLLTPGHTLDHISFIVKTNRGKVIICGDAIAAKKFLDIDPNPNFVWNLKEFKKSKKKILDKADWIIFGHGGLHKVQNL